MDIYDFFDDLKIVETLTTKDFVIKNTAMRIIGFYQVTDLGQLIDSLEQLYTESKLQSMANDMANYYGFELSVDTYETRLIAITKAFKLLQKLVNQPKYQSYYKQWLTNTKMTN